LKKNVKSLRAIPQNATAALFKEVALKNARLRLYAAHGTNLANSFY
jgi:hypothetical protein